MKVIATTQKTGFVMLRIARIIAAKTPTGAGERGLSLSRTMGKLKRPAAIPIDSPTEQTLSSSNSPNYLGRGLHQRNRKARKAVGRESQGAQFCTPGRCLS